MSHVRTCNFLRSRVRECGCKTNPHSTISRGVNIDCSLNTEPWLLSKTKPRPTYGNSPKIWPFTKFEKQLRTFLSHSLVNQATAFAKDGRDASSTDTVANMDGSGDTGLLPSVLQTALKWIYKLLRHLFVVCLTALPVSRMQCRMRGRQDVQWSGRGLI